MEEQEIENKNEINKSLLGALKKLFENAITAAKVETAYQISIGKDLKDEKVESFKEYIDKMSEGINKNSKEYDEAKKMKADILAEYEETMKSFNISYNNKKSKLTSEKQNQKERIPQSIALKKKLKEERMQYIKGEQVVNKEEINHISNQIDIKNREAYQLIKQGKYDEAEAIIEECKSLDTSMVSLINKDDERMKNFKRQIELADKDVKDARESIKIIGEMSDKLEYDRKEHFSSIKESKSDKLAKVDENKTLFQKIKQVASKALTSNGRKLKSFNENVIGVAKDNIKIFAYSLPVIMENVDDKIYSGVTSKIDKLKGIKDNLGEKAMNWLESVSGSLESRVNDTKEKNKMRDAEVIT